MALQPLNDFCMIHLDNDGNEYGFAGGEKDSAETGVLIALPDKFNYFGYYSFAFEQSFMDEEKLSKLYDYWKDRIGKRVFWLALSEKGSIIEKEGEKFSFVRLTSLIASDEADSTARNIYSDGSGGFKP